MDQNAAAAVALTALAHILGDDDARVRFLALTGLDQTTLRQRADEPELLGGVLDFLLADEALLLAFCRAAALRPELAARARRALPGAGDH